ncbi:hypothetical protein MNBD_GAMMA15-455 [hydrothermal vent metagenome]|uniref:DUF3540 domain-containing protein n=1 Tax=hydrothermal vent metagenome TaxID=652676 RepID=A0A3B0Z5K2_9ZZZZ
MPHTARKLETGSGIYHATGVVTSALEGAWMVSIDDTVLETRRAVSCLVQPETGDRVLVSISTLSGEAFMIAVLERPESSAVVLQVEGELKLSAPKGRISLSSSHGMNFTTPKDLTMKTESIDISAKKANIFFGGLSYLGHKVLVQLEKSRFVSGLLESIVDHVYQTNRTSHRVVDDMEQVRAGQIDYQASKNMNLRGKNTLLTAEELVKLDGGQIHLG